MVTSAWKAINLRLESGMLTALDTPSDFGEARVCCPQVLGVPRSRGNSSDFGEADSSPHVGAKHQSFGTTSFYPIFYPVEILSEHRITSFLSGRNLSGSEITSFLSGRILSGQIITSMFIR